MIKKGDLAPDFTLYDSDNNEHHLSDYRGKNVVLLFIPKAFTRVCTAELCQVRDEISIYNQLDTQVLAISVDDPETLAKFKEEQGYSFPLLSDSNKDTSRSYEVLYKASIPLMGGVAKRSAFVINADGIIKYAEVLENPGNVPDFTKIKETLSTLS